MKPSEREREREKRGSWIRARATVGYNVNRKCTPRRHAAGA